MIDKRGIIIILFIIGIYAKIICGNIWIDCYGTSSTSGQWDSGIRSDTTTSITPPYVVRWEKYEWAGAGVNVVPFGNHTLIYDGYVYFGQGNGATWHLNEPGWVWAWDIETGVTKTGYPIGPLDGGIDAMAGIAIGEGKLYALTVHKLYGWYLDTLQQIPGYPVSITETTDGGENVVFPHHGPIYWKNKVYFTTTLNYGYPNAPFYLYVKDGSNGTEVFRRQIPGGATEPCIWNNRVYVAGALSQQIYCFNAETGEICENFPVTITAGIIRSSVIIEGGIIYIGTQVGKFYAIDAMTGEKKWEYTTDMYMGKPEEIESTASIWGDKVYFGGHERKLYGLYKDTGEPVAGFPVTITAYSGADCPISTANGLVYFNAGNKISCVDANNGNIVWTSPLVPARGGGVAFQYNYPSITIGEKEIIAVYPPQNSIVVYCMPTPTITPTNTNSATITQTTTPTMTETITRTKTGTETSTQTITPSQTITQTHSITPTITITPTETPGLSIRIKTNYPNPFEEWTRIVYEVSRWSEIEVRIWTISGERVREIRGEGKAGENEIEWDGRNRYMVKGLRVEYICIA